MYIKQILVYFLRQTEPTLSPLHWPFNFSYRRRIAGVGKM